MRFCCNCGLMATDPRQTHCAKCGAPLPPERPAPAGEEQPPAGPRYHQAEDDGLTMGGYLASLLVFAIPIIGFILMLVWSFLPSAHPARRKLSQAYLIRTLALAALAGLLAMVLGITVFAALQAPFYGGYLLR